MMQKLIWLFRGQLLWLLVAAGAVLGFRSAMLTWRPAMTLVAVAVGGLMLAGFFSLLLQFVLLRKGQRGGGKYCLFTVGLSLPAMVGVLIIGLQGAKAPLINDISTDTVNPPPLEKASQLRQHGDNTVLYPGDRAASQQRQAYPDIGPLAVTSAPTSTFEKSRAVIEQLGWRVVAQNPEQGLIEAVDRSLIFGFTDDIVIRIAPSGSGSRIDVRSASRAGIGDLGVNAKRIRSFFSTYNAITP
jgi:uncharacterized protein (DUF1499 family)